jgi:hypothetical protein
LKNPNLSVAILRKAHACEEGVAMFRHYFKNKEVSLLEVFEKAISLKAANYEMKDYLGWLVYRYAKPTKKDVDAIFRRMALNGVPSWRELANCLVAKDSPAGLLAQSLYSSNFKAVIHAARDVSTNPGYNPVDF